MRSIRAGSVVGGIEFMRNRPHAHKVTMRRLKSARLTTQRYVPQTICTCRYPVSYKTTRSPAFCLICDLLIKG